MEAEWRQGRLDGRKQTRGGQEEGGGGLRLWGRVFGVDPSLTDTGPVNVSGSSVYNKILSVPATQRREGRQIFGACRVPEINTVTGGTARLDGREP